MSSAVADTHVLVWHLTVPALLSPRARAALADAAAAGSPVYVPSICVVELVYLAEKGRLPRAALDRLIQAMADPQATLQLAPLDLQVTLALDRVPRDVVPDMPDRIIAATAVALGLPLITRDLQIAAAPVQTIW